jgi:cob(I)alamin adenosyltransferase
MYTGLGDKGETSLMGDRVPKDHPRVAALGAVDELNAALGAALVSVADGRHRRMLEEAQEVLFIVGAELSAAGGNPSQEGLPRVTGTEVADLEASMEALAAHPVNQFVLPRGSEAAVRLHQARSVARRAERMVIALDRADGEWVSPTVLAYLNRLSSLLFTLALKENEAAGVEESSPSYGK